MGGRNHYETAFERFLRHRDVPHFANGQEYRNSLDSGESLKNFDFIVSSPGGTHWIVEVKGRRFPGGKSCHRYWKNWITRDDMTGLLHWEGRLGDGFHGLLVFAYLIEGDRAPLPVEELFSWQGHQYAFIAIDLHDYISAARLISPRWQTFELPSRHFRKTAKSFASVLAEGFFRQSTDDELFHRGENP